MKTVSCGLMLLLSGLMAGAQTAVVPIHNETQENTSDTNLLNAAAKLRDAGKSIRAETAREQLRRSSCQLKLLQPKSTKLAAREVWQHARASYLRVGWFYSSTQSSQWRMAFAGGYPLTADGAVATSYHIAEPPRDLREGCLIVADDNGKVFPVTEILAANRYSDACIIRVQGTGFVPLPLNTNIFPGDAVYCLSDPLGRRGYFSQGIVNRCFQLPERRLPNEPGAPWFAPMRINVSTDWSFGSSGAAVLDDCGNAVGQVSTISIEGDDTPANANASSETAPATIVFHEAVSARDVAALIKQPK